jgi:hypothetical protein
MKVPLTPPYSPDIAPCDFFLLPKMKIKLKGRRFDSIEEIAEGPEGADTKGLPGQLPIVAETLGSLCTLPRELL